MARPKKDSRPVTMRMDKKVYDRLNAFCERSGQPKTTAIERALTEYIDAYDKLMERATERKQD